MLEFIHRALALFAAAQAWFLAQPMPMQIVAGAVALAALWVLSVVLAGDLGGVPRHFLGVVSNTGATTGQCRTF